jgi:hypothetical protein
MSNGHGGARAGAGRPLGRRDTLPRAGKQYERMKSLAEDYDTTEFMITNNERVFAGNAAQLMVAVYKAEQIPIRVRLYAASKAAEFELRSGDGYEETFGEDYGEKLVAAIARLREETPRSEQARGALEEWFGGDISDADQQLIDQVCDRLNELHPAVGRVDAILPPAREEPVFNRRPSEVVDAVQHDCDTASEVIEKPSVFGRTMAAEPIDQPPVKPSAPRVEPVDDPDLIEVNTPTRSGWITRYVPRQS